MMAAGLRKHPALFLFLSFLLPFLEGWLFLATLPFHILIIRTSTGRGWILFCSALLGLWTGISLERAEQQWDTLSRAQGFVEVHATWNQDVYTSERTPCQGWATVTPLINGQPETRMSKTARFTLLGSPLPEDPEVGMLGHRWKGKILMTAEAPSPFMDASYGEALPTSPLVKLRNALVRRLEDNWSHLDATQSLPLLRALITGDRLGLDAQQKLPFTRLGLLALLAISGLHLGLIFLCVKWLLGRWAPDHAGLFALLVALVYATLGGWAIALTRSFGMCALATIAPWISRKYKGWNALFFMAWLELCMNPSHLWSPSFMLTYGGVVGILFVATLISRHLPHNKGPSISLRRRILESYLFSWGAMLFTWPITGIYFHSIPTWAWLWAPPFCLTFSLVMGWVFVCLLVSLLLPLPSLMLWPLDLYLELLQFLSECGAWVSPKVPDNPLWMVPYYVGLLLFLLGQKKKQPDLEPSEPSTGP